MYAKTYNMRIMINDKADEILEELHKSLHNRDQSNLEKINET